LRLRRVSGGRAAGDFVEHALNHFGVEERERVRVRVCVSSSFSCVCFRASVNEEEE